MDWNRIGGFLFAGNNRRHTHTCASQFRWRLLAFACVLLLVSETYLSSSSAVASQPVRFDANQLAIANPVDQATDWANSKRVAIELEFSVFVNPVFAGQLDSVVFSIECEHSAVRVEDYFPRTAMKPNTVGPIAIQEDFSRSHSGNIRGNASYPGIGSISGEASVEQNYASIRNYEKLPTFELLSASGTTGRQTGVFFKLNQTEHQTLEGSHRVQIVLDVPQSWRGDTLRAAIAGYGPENQRGKTKAIANWNGKIAVSLGGDQQARLVATGYVTMEQQLLDVANRYASEIDRRSFDTPLHRLGGILAIADPEIPADWLTSIIYDQGVRYPSGKFARLPVEVRVAILDYLDFKEAIGYLASGRSTSMQQRAKMEHLTSTK